MYSFKTTPPKNRHNFVLRRLFPRPNKKAQKLKTVALNGEKSAAARAFRGQTAQGVCAG